MRSGVLDRARGTWGRVVAARPHSPTLDTAFVIVDRDTATAGSLLAGALAYRLFLWLLPAALVSYAGLGFAASDGPASAADAANAAGMRQVTAASIRQAAEDAHRNRWAAFLVGLVLLYVASSHLLKALRAASMLAWEGSTRRQKTTPVAVLAVMAFSAAVTLVAVGTASLRREGSTLGLLSLIVLAAVWAALWWVASYLLPHGKATALHLVPGAIVFGIGVQLLYVLTVVYFIRKIGSASELYGTLGAAATLLLWLYLLARLIVGASVVNAVLWERGTVPQLIGRLMR